MEMKTSCSTNFMFYDHIRSTHLKKVQILLFFIASVFLILRSDFYHTIPIVLCHSLMNNTICSEISVYAYQAHAFIQSTSMHKSMCLCEVYIFLVII